ncbi:toluene-4-monooxygenase system B family protein [Trebonia sp.]|uniref:toluene-4-monooxygenase system B family protein n=1 Tax=Trebonia sp. TaxID=2767075 RepID=UPI00261E7659|nr:toluene-4-monooxygenase system B family protein [Trebonia sp.]
MALLPLSATFDGDIVSLLVAVDDEDTAEVVARKIAHHVVGHRVAPRQAPVRLRAGGRVIAQDQLVRTIPAAPLDHVEAFFDE